MNLTDQLPDGAEPDDVFAAFSNWAAGQGFTLYPHQEEALIEIVSGANVILSAPTGSGKSLVATGAHFTALARDDRTFYTAPIKALVSEKFFALCDIFGPDEVGMMTGDGTVNGGAQIICCTAEVLANLALREGTAADVGQVVMDEFHFYADPDRGWAWQVPLIELPQAQFVLMSATLGDVSRFEADLTRRTGRPTAVVALGRAPGPADVLVRDDAAARHRAGTAPDARGADLHRALHPGRGDRAGPGAHERERVHQGGEGRDRRSDRRVPVLLRLRQDPVPARAARHRRASRGHAAEVPAPGRDAGPGRLLKVICGTDTLGVGINVPIRTVLFTALSKYDGTKTRLLMAREFHQIAGRAGRAGFDTTGRVVVQAPEHVIENEKALAKAGDDPKKRRKVVRRKPPEGMVSWGQPTFDRLVAADPEPLRSSFAVSHAMLLNVVSREGNAFQAMKHLLTDNHEDRAAQRRHISRAIAIYRALLAGGVVERLPEPDADGRWVRLTVDLQKDFALNQPLSPLALAAIELLDRASPEYALDVLSVIEATLDNPRQVLSAQLFRARGEAVAAMKAEGIEYEERMDLLESVTYPMPQADLLEAAYNIYKRGHPWVADHELSPKSVVRDMFERAMTFGEYIHFYSLARSEGLVLRYLADAYKAMRQTVPEEARTEELADLIEWLGETVRQIDHSLIDEWERLRNPVEEVEHLAADRPPAVTSNPRAFRVLVRNALFRRVELAALRRWDELGELDGEDGWNAGAWADALEPYFEEHDEIMTGPDARGPGMLIIDEAAGEGEWRVRQIFDDPAGDHDWGFSAAVDLHGSDEAGVAVIKVLEVGQL